RLRPRERPSDLAGARRRARQLSDRPRRQRRITYGRTSAVGGGRTGSSWVGPASAADSSRSAQVPGKPATGTASPSASRALGRPVGGSNRGGVGEVQRVRLRVRELW